MSEPTPRRRRLSPAQRREQLVAATVTVVAERGYQGATAEAIAKEAGLSKGLLWHYFDDLEHLLESTARTTLMGLATTVGERIDLTAPVDAVIRSAVHAAAALRTSHRAERNTISAIALNLRHPDGTLRLGPADYDDLYAAQEQLFRRGQAEGTVDAKFDPRLLAVTYQSAVDGMLTYLDTHPDVDADGYASTVADVLLSGMQRAH